MKDDLSIELVQLRRAALKAVARREGLSVDDQHIVDASREENFAFAIDKLRSYAPWYVSGYERLRGWLFRFGSRGI